MGQDLDFAALIGSRICHDLISPIGAINNGIELMEMSMPAPTAEMALISESVTNASARIRFFRIAFGAGSAQMVGRPEVNSILKDNYAAGRLTVAWGPLDGQERWLVRMCFLALMCMETGMPYGGRVEVREEAGTFILYAQADKFKIEEPLWAMLEGGARIADLRPAHVQFGLLPLIAADAGRPLSVSLSEQEIEIRF